MPTRETFTARVDGYAVRAERVDASRWRAVASHHGAIVGAAVGMDRYSAMRDAAAQARRARVVMV